MQRNRTTMKLAIVFLLFFLEVILTDEFPNKKFKLSDLPVLKKWEIPNHHFSRRVGRKYKDLDRDTKRSAYWELKPDFTANELEWDEDPEKLSLDFNYKGFLEDDDEDMKGQLDEDMKGQLEKQKAKKDSLKTEKRNLPAHAHDVKHSTRKNRDKSKFRKKMNKEVKDVSLKKKARSKRSIVEEQDGEEIEDMLPNSFFIENIEDGDEYDDEIRNKRAAIWSAVRQLEMSDGSLNGLNKQADENTIVRRHVTPQRQIAKRQQQSKHAGIKYPTPVIMPRKLSRSSIATNQEERKKLSPNEATVVNRRDKILSTKEGEGSVHNARNVIENHKKQKAGELGDEQMRRNKEKMEKDFKSARQNIGRPDMNVDPANVARAVTMAMEQLKRDKMWGKVFVHVRPSGQLKVMVQETKRMDASV